MPTWTFTATAEVVRYLGADPVLVDVDPETLNIDLDAAAAAVTVRDPGDHARPLRRAAVSRAGVCATSPRGTASRVVEDAAHAFPVDVGGELVGCGRERRRPSSASTPPRP